MSLKDDLNSTVKSIFSTSWTARDGTVVPEADAIQLGNDGVNLDATVLYADMDASTNLVDAYKPAFAAEVYKAYLHCAAKVIRSEGGEVTAYDGDRIMGVFIEGAKNTAAVRAALKINYCVREIINPQLKAAYPSTSYEVKQTVGIDTSKLLVARTGVRGANDLVWVGRAANYAAKLTTLGPEYPTWITSAVYDAMLEATKISNGRGMWEQMLWNTMNKMTIYRSNWWWRVD
jgi:class 3 adenylate cyclase